MAHLLLNVDARDHERAEKSRFLEQAGYRVVEAATEAEALRLIQAERFVLAVVNNRLPQVDGFRLGRQIKASAGRAGPFVLLLAPAFDGAAPPLDQIADAFLPAPPYYPALLAQVKLLVRLAEASRMEEEAAAERERLERTRAETEATLAHLRANEARYRQLVEALPVLIWTAHPDGLLDYASPHWAAFTGLPAAHQLGAGWLDLVHTDDRTRVEESWQISIEHQVPFSTDLRIRSHDGTYRWFEAQAVALPDGSGQVHQWLGVLIEIDSRKRLVDRLLELDGRKNEFLGALAGELRDPLGPIRTCAALLRLIDPAETTLGHTRDVIDRQVARLTRLVDDLLDVSRIVQGSVRLGTGTHPLTAVVDRAVEATRPLLEARRVGLTVVLPPRPLPIEGDFPRLVQALTSLLENGAKFAREGGSIRLEVETEGDEALIRVRDDGIGIRPDLLPLIFELFVRGDPERGGLGIGLTIARAIVELHGGAISASSLGPDRGSEFVARLPLASGVPAHPGYSDLHQEDPGLRVLVVDSNDDAARSLALLLGLRGYSVRIAPDCSAAVPLGLVFKPGVVVLDLGLGGLDVQDLVRRLRSAAGAEEPVIVALTADPADQDGARQAVDLFDHVLVKPVDPDLLQAVIASGQATKPEPT